MGGLRKRGRVWRIGSLFEKEDRDGHGGYPMSFVLHFLLLSFRGLSKSFWHFTVTMEIEARKLLNNPML